MVDILIRPLTTDNAQEVDAVHALVTAAAKVDQTVFITHEALRTVARPEIETVVAELPDGTIAGFAWWNSQERPAIPLEGWVHPDFRRKGVGTALLGGVERQARLLGAERLTGRSYTNIQGALPLFQACGFSEMRRFNQMWVDLDVARLDAPKVEAAIVRKFRPEDVHELYEADQEAFSTHWGTQPMTFEVWEHRRMRHGFDPDLWILVWLDGRIVAFTLCHPSEFGDPDDGWVSLVGVRPAYRGRGLGRLALVEGMKRLQQVGFKRAGLHVDSENAAAVNLYESVGLRTTRERVHFGKELRTMTRG